MLLLLFVQKVWNGSGLRRLTSADPVSKHENKGKRQELEKIYPVPSRESLHGSLRQTGYLVKCI